ncbi:hypothetical protein D3C72_1740700 [compost metagenome]
MVIAQGRQVAEGTAQQQLDVVPAQLIAVEGVHIDLPLAAGEAHQEVAGEADPLHIQAYLAAELDDEDAEAHRDALPARQHLGQIAVDGREVILPVAPKAQGLVETLQQLAAHLVTVALGNRLVQPAIEAGQLGLARAGSAQDLVADGERQLGQIMGLEVGPFVHTYHRHHS